MPWTFSHPAAVLPLRRLCPFFLSFPALVAGSLAPDLPYYVGRFAISDIAHTPGGSFICIPLGLAALLFFHLLRRPLWFLLPQPHRAALEPLLARRPRFDARTMLSIMLSLLLGAWTHLLWDSFTHENTWMVRHLPWIDRIWLRFGTVELHGYTVLQDLSTLLGFVALALAYRAWLRRQPATPTPVSSDAWRYVAVLAVGAVSLSAATIFTIHATPPDITPERIRFMIVRIAILSVSIFAALFGAYAAGYYVLKDKH